MFFRSFRPGAEKISSSGDSGCWSCFSPAFWFLLPPFTKSTEFSEKTVGKPSKTFFWFAHLAISLAICWIVNNGSLWLVSPSAAPGRGTPHSPYTAPLPTLSLPTPAQPCPSGTWRAAGWGHSHHTHLEGRRCTSVLNTFPFLDHWKLPQELERHPELQMGNVLSNPDTLCKSWDDWLNFGHLSCPSSPSRSISLHCRRTRGTQKGRDFLVKKVPEPKFWGFFLQKIGRSAQNQVNTMEKYVYLPISSCLNIKTQLTKTANRHLSHLQILPPKVNLYILMGMAVSFLPRLCLFHFRSLPTGLQFWSQ